MYNKLEITPDWLEKSINYEWEKSKRLRGFDSNDLTHLIFEDLYRIIKENPALLKVTYETLAKLNEKDGNTDMVDHLNSKKQQFFNQVVVHRG
ncbi:hypothetical protein [Priestia megaterium]|uniref:hypothetical protein n=1 Tax=Priestia megaterium TaxID=1404 RepID=UPI000BF3E0FD|nr:hypothetical protein [Priestia megaterium]PFI93398.1 hypothetical protein COI84_19725 [Priestia megaterium]PGR11785.1 hypothetical protein COC62_14275 [Priestia megaterium]